MAAISWDAPSDNNSPIQKYNVYLSSKRIHINEIRPEPQAHTKVEEELRKIGVITEKEDRYFEFKNLDKGTCYYVVVTAVNELGEGYKAVPTMLITLHLDINTKSLSPYVWGSNVNSEIGLSDDIVLKNISYYKKYSMNKAVRNTMFERESVLAAAAGST